MCAQWIDAEFESVDLGDRRRADRLRCVLSRLFESSSQSILASCHGWAEAIGAYRLLSNTAVTPDAVIGAHVGKTLERAREFETLLYVQDTSELDFSMQTKLEGAGPLSSLQKRGYYLDLSHLFNSDGLNLGTLRCHFYTHNEEVYGQSDARAKKLPIEEKESFRWLEGFRHSCQLQSLLPQSSLIYVADAEADIYDIYDQWYDYKEQGESCCNWIIRRRYNRVCFPLAPSVDLDPSSAELPPSEKIESLLHGCAPLGQMQIKVNTKLTSKTVKGDSSRRVRKARTLRMTVKSTRVQLQVPKRPAGSKPLAAVAIWIVQAKEIDPPEEEEPMDWTLLTSLPAESFEQARDILAHYAKRWGVEVVFRVLKSGCRIEKLQLKNTRAVQNAIACYLVVAWRILFLTKVGRACPQLPCDCVFETDEWQAIWAIEHGVDAVKEREADEESPVPSLNELILLIARYGGHLGRKSDGPPGAQTMWVGLQRLRDFTLAWKQFNPLESVR